MNEFKQQENAEKGEARSRALLSDHFWLLSRSVDVDGVDIIVQKRVSTKQKLIEQRSSFETFGYVQAKFFEGKNQVRILKDYVKDGENVRVGFFAFLHTDDDEGEPVHYFFTANEIVKEWYISKCGNYYCFSLTEERKYCNFKNRKKSDIEELITVDIHKRKSNLSFFLVSRFFQSYLDVRNKKQGERVTYLLRILENCPVVLYRSKNNHTRLLEPRRDLFNYSGDFRWGHKGTSAQFLCASLLGHFLGGKMPTLHERRMLLQNLVSLLDENEEYDITEDVIRMALHGNECMLIPKKFFSITTQGNS
ncbi:MAG: hypothetical protein D6732_21335 [Methanobacteriota archaeon]|nr:MAG: hypothetical protein D6732_21335 [Euryarchaeota archaeon]